jgi:hypothetical protein
MCATQADPRQDPQEGYDAPTLVAQPAGDENHDLTLEEHSEAFEEEFGEAVSTSTVGRAVARFLPDGGWPLKKVEGSLRTRRRSEGPVAMAGFPL